MSMPSIDSIEVRSIVAEPALTVTSRSPSAAPPRSTLADPALSCRRTSSVGTWGRVIPHESRLPRTQNGPLRSGDLTWSEVSVASICGLVPSALWPATCHAAAGGDVHGHVTAVEAHVDRAGLRERAVAGRERRRVAGGPAGAGRERADPGAEQPADHQPDGRGDDEPADEGERRPAQDQAEADADEDQRPQAPQASDLVVGQVARSNGERDGPGEDQEDAPAQVPATHTHADNGSRPSPAGNGRTS